MVNLQPTTFNLRPNAGFTQHYFSRQKNSAGFIALTATIIVAAVLLVLTVSIASSGFQGRFAVFDGEVKEASRALAEACVETAILKHAKDGAVYTGSGDVVVVDAGRGWTCTVLDVDSTDLTAVVIRVQAVVREAYTNLEVTVDSTIGYSVNSWEEVPEFP